MSSVSKDVLFERAVDLVLKQGDYADQWASRQVTVHAGLATAVGVIVSWKGFPLRPLVSFAVFVLAVLGIVLAILVNGIIRRHLAWQSGLVESVKRIEGEPHFVFRDNMLPEGAPKVRMADFHRVITTVLCVVWALIAVAALVTMALAG